MARVDLKNMTLPEIIELREEIDSYLKERALEEIETKERELNDLRRMAGLKVKATSGAIAKGRASAKAAKAPKP